MRKIIFCGLWMIGFLFLMRSQAREIERNFQMKQFKQTNGWFYVGKIVLRAGRAEVKITTEVIEGTAKNHGGEVALYLVENQHWGEETQKKCKSPSRQPILKHQLLLQGSISISEHSVQIEKQQLYYFVIKDCGKKFETDYGNSELEMKVVISIINSGGFMGEEEDHWLTFPVMIAIGLWMVMTDKYFLKGEFQQDPDYAKMILFGAIGTNISSLMWRSFGYLIYLFQGSNYILFHLIYLFMHAVSETMVLSLLVLVSLGWSLNFLVGPKLNIAIPCIALTAVANIILILATQLYNTTHDMHHTFDAPTGYALIFIRLSISAAFLISIFATHQHSRYRVRQFLRRFGFFGFLYLCSMPLVVYIANSIVPAPKRSEFVFISVEALKTVCNICLMYMVSSSRSEYNKLCYKNASFLPTQTGLF